MINLSWAAEIIFFGSYFIAWLNHELAHTTWINVSAIAAIVIAVMLLVFNGYPYIDRRNPQA